MANKCSVFFWQTLPTVQRHCYLEESGQDLEIVIGSWLEAQISAQRELQFGENKMAKLVRCVRG